jgi:hypothetical protein
LLAVVAVVVETLEVVEVVVGSVLDLVLLLQHQTT